MVTLMAFLLFSSVLFADSFDITNGKVYNYNSTNSVVTNYSIYESGINYLPGEYGGIGIRAKGWNVSANLTGYDVMYFEAKSDIAMIDVVLKEGAKESSPQAFTLSSSYVEYSYSLSQASLLDLSKIEELQFKLKHNVISTKVYVKKIRFVDTDGNLPDYYVEGKDFYIYPTATATEIRDFSHYVLQGKNSSIDNPSYSGFGLVLNNNGDSDWDTPVDLSLYKRIAVTINSKLADQVSFQFKMGDDSASSEYQLSIPEGDSFVEVDFDRFTSLDLTNVKALQINLKSGADILYTLVLNSVVFDDVDNYSPVTTQILIEKLASLGFPVTNDKLTGDSNYISQIKNVWNGYKKHFIQEYLTYADVSVQGLVFDSQSFAPAASDSVSGAHYIKSEGVGFGLLLSIFMNDQATYDMILSKIWPFIQSSGSGLMPWKIDSSGGVIDSTAASDADIDLAISLVFAKILVEKGAWSSSFDYGSRSQLILDSIYAKLVENNRYLKAGDTWGGKHITSLSYFSPAWFKIFSLHDKSDHDWTSIIDQSYETLKAQLGYSNGLVPDWCDASGASVTTYYADRKYYLRWDAVRTYWRVALDAVWNNDLRAKEFLDNTRNQFPSLASMQSATFMKMDGTNDPDFNFTDMLIIGMFTTGAMGSSSDTYKSNWKSVFDGYLIHTNESDESYYGVQAGTADKYNYYLQSMTLLGSLLMTGAMPDIYDYFSQNSSLAASTSGVSTIWNNTAAEIPVTYTSTQGAGYISSIMLDFESTGINASITAENLKYSGACNISGAGIKIASYTKSVDGNNLNVTFNVVFDAEAWGNRTVTLKATGTPVKGSSFTSDIGSFAFKPYSREFVSSANIDINFGMLKRGVNVVSLPDPIAFAADISSWNIMLYSDNIATRNDDSGLMGMDVSGNADFLPVDVMYNLTGVMPSPSDSRWKSIYDVDAGKTFLREGTASLAKSNHYLFFKCDAISAKGTDYFSGVTLKVNSEKNIGRVDDFQDNSLLNEFGTYWSAVNLFSDTVASVSVMQDGDNSFMRLNYNLGSAQSINNKPEAMAIFTTVKNNPTLATDMSTYQGIAFDVKADKDVAFAVSLESKVHTADYDEFHYELGQINNGWLHYEILFDDFKQYGWGSVSNINNVLKSLNAIKFKTLSEQTGENANIDIDNVILIK